MIRVRSDAQLFETEAFPMAEHDSASPTSERETVAASGDVALRYAVAAIGADAATGIEVLLT